MLTSSIVAATLFASGSSFAAAWLAMRRQSVAGGRPFVWLMLTTSAWSLLSGLHTLAADPTIKIGLVRLQYVAIACVPSIWLLVVHRVTGHPPVGRRALALLALFPLLTIGLAWTNEWHGWIWRQITPAGAALVYHHGHWFGIATAYNYGLLGAALLILARALQQTPPAFHPQLRGLLVAGCLPWVANVLYLTRAIPIPGFDLTPIAFTLSGLLTMWGLTRQRLLDLVPIARDVLIDHIGDGVIVLDHQQRIVDHNPAAVRLSGLAAGAVGQPIATALPALAPAVTTGISSGATPLLEPFGPAEASVAVQTTPLASRRGQAAGWLVVLRDITAQQTLARRLRAEHDFALQVMQTMGEGLTVTDTAGQFTFVNDAYARLFGYTPADLIGRSPVGLTLEEDRATLLGAKAMREEGQTNSYLSRLQCADGRIVTVQITGVPRVVDGQPAGSIAVITDLSERLAAETALRTAEQTLRSFFDSTGVMMGIVELGDDDILHIKDNAVTAAFFGTTVEALRGQWASAMGVPPETMQRWLRAYRESAQSGRPVQFDYVHTSPQGQFWLAATVCCIGPADDGRTRYSYVVTDVTMRKEAEQQLRVSQQQLEAANAQLRDLARTDGLTGLWNRGAFDERLAEEIARAIRYHTPLSLLLIDIDHFKPYNDTYGHVAGDEMLRRAARLFQQEARQSDLVARYGGEEFAIILPNIDVEESVLAAERIRSNIEQARWPERVITISIGVATFRRPLTAEQFVEMADVALYRAKHMGRNMVVHVCRIAPELCADGWG